MITKTFLQWSLVCLILLFLLGLTGCSTIRTLTMTQDELRLFGSWTVKHCLDPDVVCIHD